MNSLRVIVCLLACALSFACRNPSSMISVSRPDGNGSSQGHLLPALESNLVETANPGAVMESATYRSYSSLGSVGSGNISSGTQYHMTSLTITTGNLRFGSEN